MSKTKWQVRVNRINNILVIRKDTLRSFRTKIGNGRIVINWTNMRTKHHIELADIAPVRLATSRALHVKRLKLFGRHTLGNAISNFVGTEAAMALSALNERIGKSGRMARSNPCTWVHNNCRINAVNILTAFYPVIPPGIHNFTLQSNAHWAKIPSTSHATIDIAARINKSAAFTQTNNIFHLCHNVYILPQLQAFALLGTAHNI